MVFRLRIVKIDDRVNLDQSITDRADNRQIEGGEMGAKNIDTYVRAYQGQDLQEVLDYAAGHASNIEEPSDGDDSALGRLRSANF